MKIFCSSILIKVFEGLRESPNIVPRGQFVTNFILDAHVLRSITGLHFIFYADDLVSFAEDTVPINEGFQVLHEWSKRNGINVSPLDKCDEI